MRTGHNEDHAHRAGLSTTNVEAAVATMPAVEGPWADFNARVRSLTSEVYDGPTARFRGPLESVAKMIEKVHEGPAEAALHRHDLAPAAMMARNSRGDRGWDLAVKGAVPPAEVGTGERADFGVVLPLWETAENET